MKVTVKKSSSKPKELPIKGLLVGDVYLVDDVIWDHSSHSTGEYTGLYMITNNGAHRFGSNYYAWSSEFENSRFINPRKVKSIEVELEEGKI